MSLPVPVTRRGAAMTATSVAAAVVLLGATPAAEAEPAADSFTTATRPVPVATSAPTSGSSVGHAAVTSVTSGSMAAMASMAGVTITAPPQTGPAPAGQLPSAAARTATSTQPDAVTGRLDVDGDRRADRTTFELARSTDTVKIFRLSTRTATGRTASKLIRVNDDDMGGPDARTAWIGAGVIDGARGADVVLDVNGGGPYADFPVYNVYTMRSGSWQLLSPPGAPRGDNTWDVTNGETYKAGYAFSTTRAGVRRVVVSRLTMSNDDLVRARFAGTRTTYRWDRTRWVKVGTQRVRGLTRAQASALAGLNGVTLR